MDESKTKLRLMNPWQTKIRLKFPGKLFKRNVGFCFSWQAWFIAYDTLDVEPDEFLEKDSEQQMNALAYGAAFWFCARRRERFFFTYESLTKALNRASMEDYKKIEAALKSAQFPEWMEPPVKMKVKP